jgi:uncharacterized protein (DUF2147 family)
MMMFENFKKNFKTEATYNYGLLKGNLSSKAKQIGQSIREKRKEVKGKEKFSISKFQKSVKSDVGNFTGRSNNTIKRSDNVPPMFR